MSTNHDHCGGCPRACSAVETCISGVCTCAAGATVCGGRCTDTTTDRFDHCVFTVRKDFPADREKQWLKVLFSMSYENPKHREMMDMEGLKAWLPGRTSGYGPLAEAVGNQRFFGAP